MKRALLLLPLSLCLMAFRCGETPRPDIEFPALPDLPPRVAEPCPPAAPATGSLGDLAAKDAALSIDYASCQSKHAAAVGAYQDAQAKLRAASLAAAAAGRPKPK